MAQATLTKRGTDKSGNTSYSREGVRASVYFNKNMFSGDAPSTIVIDAENLAEPGAVKPSANSAEKAAKAQERAAKAQARAEKAKAAADKAAAAAAKYATTPAAEPVPA